MFHHANEASVQGGPARGEGDAGTFTNHDVRSSADILACVTVATDVGKLAATWLQLEATAVYSPYQSLSWVCSWLDKVALARRETPFIIIVWDKNDLPTMIVPLVLRRRFGCRIASFPGGKHANYALPVMRRDCSFSQADITDVLSRAASLRPDIDLFVFNALPSAWNGVDNPLVDSASRIYPAASSTISLNVLSSVQRPTTGRKRRKAQSRERRFLQVGAAKTSGRDAPADIGRILAEFARQRARWALEKKERDAFGEPGILAFIGDLVVHPQSRTELHWLEADGEILAIAGTATSCRRTSLMFVSYDAASSAASLSPGLRLIEALIAEAAQHGVTTMDLGLGDATYKKRLHAVHEPIFASYRPVTRRGHLAAAAINMIRCVKLILKMSPSFSAWAKSMARRLQLHAREHRRTS